VTPMVVLYNLSIIVSWIVTTRRENRASPI